MAEPQKFTEEELKQITELQQSYAKITAELGQETLRHHVLTSELTEVEANIEASKQSYTATRNKEQELIDSLSKKYGDGVLDLDSGVFTPKS
jgi:DNA-binding transcriptional regulator GbsR (MarR family)